MFDVGSLLVLTRMTLIAFIGKHVTTCYENDPFIVADIDLTSSSTFAYIPVVLYSRNGFSAWSALCVKERFRVIRR